MFEALCQLFGSSLSMALFSTSIQAFLSDSCLQAKQACLVRLPLLAITEIRISPAYVGSTLLIIDEVPIELIVWLVWHVGVVPGPRESIYLVSSIVRMLPTSLTVGLCHAGVVEKEEANIYINLIGLKSNQVPANSNA